MKISACTLAHCMWLQPSFFWMGDLQLAHGLELVSSHRQLAASSYASLTPATEENAHKQQIHALAPASQSHLSISTHDEQTAAGLFDWQLLQTHFCSCQSAEVQLRRLVTLESSWKEGHAYTPQASSLWLSGASFSTSDNHMVHGPRQGIPCRHGGRLTRGRTSKQLTKVEASLNIKLPYTWIRYIYSQ